MSLLINLTIGKLVFVCQREYVEVLINELGLNYVNNINSTYTRATKPGENKFDLEINIDTI